MNKANTLFTVVIALGIGFFVGYVVGGAGTKKAGSAEETIDTADVDKYPSEAKGLIGAPVHGKKHAKVHMIEISDFQCPFCKRGGERVHDLMEKYGDDLSVSFIHLPLGFHKRAVPAAQAAEAANLQGKFWEYQDLLWENNKALEDADLETYAKQIGLDMEKWKKAKDSKAVVDFVKKNAALANGLGITGTPGFFINGELMKGAQPLEKFIEVIDKKMAEAEALLAKGLPIEKLHSVVTRNAMEGKFYSIVVEGKIPTPKPPAPPKPDLDKKKFEIEIGSSPRNGHGNEVVIMEFSDFQCPYCSKVVGFLDEVYEHYGEEKASISFKQFPLSFHKDAQLAAEASLAAHAQGKFWPYYHKLFENQKQIKRTDLERYAQDLELDMVVFNQQLDEGTWKGQIQEDMKLAKKVGVKGTPSIFVNGRRYNGPRTKEGMIKVIDTQLLGKK
jgi:protein-disulfide isomerase